MRLSAGRIAQVFGWRLHKRLPGKLSTVLEKAEHDASHHHVLRAYAKNAVMRMYEKCSTFLRLEALSNNLKDFGLNKSLDNLDQVRRTLAAVTDRFAASEARALDVHVHFSLFQRLALPIPTGSHKIPSIKIHDTRMVRLMEVLLHAGTKVLGWRTAEIHLAIVSSFSLAPATYTLTQLRYDLRKMKVHGLLQRDGRRYAYHLTDKGTRVSALHPLSSTRLRPARQQPLPPPPNSSAQPTLQARGRLPQSRSIHRPCHSTPGRLKTTKSQSKILRLTPQASIGSWTIAGSARFGWGSDQRFRRFDIEKWIPERQVPSYVVESQRTQRRKRKA